MNCQPWEILVRQEEHLRGNRIRAEFVRQIAGTRQARENIFFRKTGVGFNEVVRVCVEAHAGRSLPASVELLTAGHPQTQPLRFGGESPRHARDIECSIG